MKNSIFLALVLSVSVHASASPLHLDLEMTSAEYEQILKKTNFKSRQADPQVETMIVVGQRLSKWIAKINEGRTSTTAIRLTSPGTRIGIPIDKPSIYNPRIIGDKLTTIARDLPAEMKAVVLGKGEIPGTTSIDDETFIKHARLLDKNYQSAARYKSVDQYRSHYITASARDVRGYYVFATGQVKIDDLRDVGLIPAAKVPVVKDALTKICDNTFSGRKDCAATVEKAFADNALMPLFNQTFPTAERNWKNFFDIPVGAARRDVRWYSNSMAVPFNTPTIAKFAPYLKDNIEAEFQWKGWRLNLNFGIYPNGPLLKFESGVVPHVNGLGGNIITMDSNQPIEEYESQWTIRHEFGHVIGLPDCYHEFYDKKLNAYVNYQLNTTDLMCSRAGNMNERIYLELKKHYGK